MAANKRFAKKAKFIKPRLLVEMVKGPLKDVVTCIDEAGDRALHTISDKVEFRHNVTVMKTYFKMSKMFSPWIQRILDQILSRWLKVFRRLSYFLRHVEDDVPDFEQQEFDPCW